MSETSEQRLDREELSDLRRVCAKMQADKKALLDALKKIEFVDMWGREFCPRCGRHPASKHQEGCDIAKAIAQAEKED